VASGGPDGLCDHLPGARPSRPAFPSQGLAVSKELGFDPAKVDPNGGAQGIALAFERLDF